MPVRIYEIAKKVGISSKEVLAKAKELGITNAKVASSTLDKITAEYLEGKIAGTQEPEPETAPVAIEPVIITAPAEEPEEETADETEADAEQDAAEEEEAEEEEAEEEEAGEPERRRRKSQPIWVKKWALSSWATCRFDRRYANAKRKKTRNRPRTRRPSGRQPLPQPLPQPHLRPARPSQNSRHRPMAR